jgi:hypothetical protein
MCAVSLHSGVLSRSVSVLYDWNFLAMCPCILIRASNTYCYEVSGYGMLVVGHGLVRKPSSLFLGDSGRRSLLSLHPSAAGFLHENHSVRHTHTHTVSCAHMRTYLVLQLRDATDCYLASIAALTGSGRPFFGGISCHLD